MRGEAGCGKRRGGAERPRGRSSGSYIVPQLQDPGVIFPEEFLRAPKGVPRAKGWVSHR